jgi:hypothetical protein
MRLKAIAGLICIAAFSLSVVAQEAPTGAPQTKSRGEAKALEAFKGKVSGIIVWSTSRANSKHDIWMMNADGTEKKPLTATDNNVDWFARISPDGQTVLFTRSKSGWVPETDAKYYEKWDLYTIGIDGSDEKKAVENACWGTWRPNGEEVVFARGTKAFKKNLSTGEETLLLDGDKAFKEGTIVQQPQMSPDGKCLAATLRGTSRETGIWNLDEKKWNNTGAGCQVNWFPAGNEIYRMNPTGNGGTAAPSEVLVMKVENCAPVDNIGGLRVPRKMRLMDLPGRRSHEYFPKFDDTKGEWMVWCATDAGHDHDLYDYEVYIWKRGAKAKEAVRLTFHSGNDRWPDIYIK